VQPTKIVDVLITSTSGDRKRYTWRCDNGKSYCTSDMAYAIGTTKENLLCRFKRWGLDNGKLWQSSKPYTKKPRKSKKSKWNALPGDRVVLRDGSEVEVLQEVYVGCARFKEKSDVTVGKIDRTGIILRRNPIFVGDKWEHKI